MRPYNLNVHYESPDFDTSFVFFRDVLGLPVVESFEDNDKRGVVFGIGDGGQLEFFGRRNTQDVSLVDCHLRLKFMVDDVQAEYQRLQRSGVKVLEPLEDKPWGERTFTLEAPDGVRITLSQVLST